MGQEVTWRRVYDALRERGVPNANDAVEQWQFRGTSDPLRAYRWITEQGVLDPNDCEGKVLDA
jgi:hypothetical protein